MSISSNKVSLKIPKGLSEEEVKNWKRDFSIIIRPIVVITTVSKEGIPNAALKTNFMVVSSLEKVAFACYPEHDTYRNIVETGEFVVNVPSEDILEKILITAIDFPHNVNELEKAGLTPIPSEKVKPPRIAECKFHLECRLEWIKDNVILGKVIAVSIDKKLIQPSVEKIQRRLKQIFLISSRNYGTIGKIKELPLEILEKHRQFNS